MHRVGIAGASGYTGGELLRLLARHPRVRLTHVAAERSQGRSVEETFPNLRGVVRHEITEADWRKIGETSAWPPMRSGSSR